MSRENVELVRRWYVSIPGLPDADDSAFLEKTFRDFLDEQWECHLPGQYPEGGPIFRGQAGWTALVAMLRDTWAEWRFDPERFLDAGDRVVVFVRVVAVGRTSGVPIELATAHVVTVRDRRMTSATAYLDRRDALEVVGLAEPPN